MTTYNGHRSWAHWNVALWISNDEALCATARAYRQDWPARVAARFMVEELALRGRYQTPDGARYTVATVTAALRDLEGP